MGYLWRINITLTLKLIHSSSIEYRAKSDNTGKSAQNSAFVTFS